MSEPAIDFQLASEASSGAGLIGVPDNQVLEIAARDGRILVTHDRRTILVHFAEFIAREVSPGVVVISQRMPLARAVMASDDLGCKRSRRVSNEVFIADLPDPAHHGD